MPIYSFLCATCQRPQDRRLKMAAIDSPQVCDLPIRELTRVRVDSFSVTTSGIELDGAVVASRSATCSGVLVREEVALTALQAHSWQP